MTARAASSRLRQAVPWIWLAMSMLWAIVIIVTDQIAWPLALWVATTLGPLTYLRTPKHPAEPGASNTGGTHD